MVSANEGPFVPFLSPEYRRRLKLRSHPSLTVSFLLSCGLLNRNHSLDAVLLWPVLCIFVCLLVGYCCCCCCCCCRCSLSYVMWYNDEYNENACRVPRLLLTCKLAHNCAHGKLEGEKVKDGELESLSTSHDALL